MTWTFFKPKRREVEKFNKLKELLILREEHDPSIRLMKAGSGHFGFVRRYMMNGKHTGFVVKTLLIEKKDKKQQWHLKIDGENHIIPDLNLHTEFTICTSCDNCDLIYRIYAYKITPMNNQKTKFHYIMDDLYDPEAEFSGTIKQYIEEQLKLPISNSKITNQHRTALDTLKSEMNTIKDQVKKDLANFYNTYEVIHRDLHLDNIYLTKKNTEKGTTYNIRFIDLGRSLSLGAYIDSFGIENNRETKKPNTHILKTAKSKAMNLMKQINNNTIGTITKILDIKYFLNYGNILKTAVTTQNHNLEFMRLAFEHQNNNINKQLTRIKNILAVLKEKRERRSPTSTLNRKQLNELLNSLNRLYV